MDRRIWLVFLAFLTIGIMLPGASAETVEYTPTTKTVCDGGTCTKTLYSGTRFGYEDSTWKPVESLRSYVGSTNIECLVTEDDDTGAICEDYNATHISLNLSLKNMSMVGDPIPVKIINSSGMEIPGRRVNIQFSKGDERIVQAIPYSIGESIHIGEDSTTVILQDADTENLDDCRTYEAIPDNNYNGEATIDADTNTFYAYGWIKFAMPTIPDSSDITESLLCLVTESIATGKANWTDVYNSTNITWSEELITWNTQDLASLDTLQDSVHVTADETEYCFNVTSAFNTSYSDSAVSITFFTNGSTNNITDVDFHSKEAATVHKRPSLNITYERGEVTWFKNQTSSTGEFNPASLNFNVTVNITGAQNVGIDTILIEGNWSGAPVNYTMTNITYEGSIYNYTIPGAIASGSYYWKVYANDTGSEWNVTSEWPFTLAKNTSNPVNSNITYSGTNYFNTSVTTQSDVSVTLNSYLSYSDGGTATLYVDGVETTIPSTKTWGVGTYNIKVNTSGNANYTSNTTGLTVVLSIEGPVGAGGPGGGGGRSTFAITAPGACDSYRLEPGVAFSGSAPVGEEIYPFTLFIYNGDTTQEFNAQLENALLPYCEITNEPQTAIPPNGFGKVDFECLAPNGTVSGNLLITTNLGCTDSRAVIISSSIGFLADIEAMVEFLGRGDLLGAISVMTNNYYLFSLPIQVPTMLLVGVAIVMFFAGLGYMAKE